MECGYIVNDGRPPVYVLATTHPGSGHGARFRVVDFDEFIATAFEFAPHGLSHDPSADAFPGLFGAFEMLNRPVRLANGSTLP